MLLFWSFLTNKTIFLEYRRPLLFAVWPFADAKTANNKGKQLFSAYISLIWAWNAGFVIRSLRFYQRIERETCNINNTFSVKLYGW
jgi:hypothetical protein